MPPSAPEAIGRYQILHSIGQGGMGSIYLARDPKIGNRQVVIKVLREGFDNPEMRERFAREANAAGGLRHVNIVTIFDVGDFEGQPFIAMEYIKGTTLTDVIDRRAELSLPRKLQLMEELCAGLHYAHKAGVVHRDIKPANIMIDEEGLLKIVDFGIARLRSAGTGVTRTGTVMGTLNYMAPEQMAGQPVDAQADIFSFGAVFYEVLSYRRAFPGDFPSIIQKILTAQREPLDAVVADLDPALGAIVDRCLAKDVADRCKDLNEIRLELAAVRQRIALAEHLKQERQLQAWLAEAKGDIDRGALTAASLLVERALSVNSLSSEALALRKAIDDVRRRLGEAAPEKTRVIEGALQRARRQLEAGSPDVAMQAVNEALKIDSTHADTLLMKEAVTTALKTADLEGRAKTAIADARRQFATGDHRAALIALEKYQPQLPIVTKALTELQVEAHEMERRRAEAERQKVEADVERLKREAATERLKLEAEAERQKLAAQAERQRLEAEAERKRLEAEVERLKREGQDARRRFETQAAQPKAEPVRAVASASPAAASRAQTAGAGKQRGLVIGGLAAAVVVLAVAGWMFFGQSSGNRAEDVVEQPPTQAGEQVAAAPPPVVPPPVVPPQTTAPQVTDVAREPVAAPPVETSPSRPPAPAPAAVSVSAPPPARGRGQPAQGATVATRGPARATQPAPAPAAPQTTAAAQTAAQQPAASQPAVPPPAAAADTTAARNRDVQQAIDNGTRAEAAGDLPLALQWFDTGRRADPSNAVANQAATRVRDRMKKEGTEAFARARTNDTLGRDEQAIKEYQIAVRYLPDDDPNKQIARTRLAALDR